MFNLHAAGVLPDYVMSRAITADVAGQKVDLAPGQAVTVIGMSGGMATIRVTLPNGSLSIIQTPVGNLQIKAPSLPVATPVPSAPPVSQTTPAAGNPANATPPGAGPAPTDLQGGVKSARTKAEVDALIDTAGNTKPDWWNSTPMTIPPNLDLTWKSQGAGPKDIGAYIWNVIDPNPGKWKEGIKLLQHSISLCKGNRTAQESAAASLARIYSECLGDYARGGFWAKKAGTDEIKIVECYMKLGCPQAAIDMLRAIGSDQTRNGQAIKLWAELGDLKTALEWAEQLAPTDPTVAYLAAGDACRLFGKIPEATAYYQKVLEVTKQVQRDDPVNKKRAAASIEAIKLFDSLDLSKIPDGIYKDSSLGYVGPVEVTVTVKDHKIVSVAVGNHHEKQFYSSVTDVPPRIVAKQSVKGIDTTTGATVTSEAIINATAKALSGAQK